MMRNMVNHLSRASKLVCQEASLFKVSYCSSYGALSPDRENLDSIFTDIHAKLNIENEISSIAKYYFDGQGKVIRPVLIMLMAKTINEHLDIFEPSEYLLTAQRKIALAAEMYHTASLMHDDVIDHAETRRGKESVNIVWGQHSSIIAGNYSVAIAMKLLSELKIPEVVLSMTQILESLVVGEIQQMISSNKSKSDRYQSYIDKTFNKTASLMAFSCKSVVQAASIIIDAPSSNAKLENMAFDYGKNLGIAFQLIDDCLDFVANSQQLGKPAAADLKLGLATAPVLFACKQYPELEKLIKREFVNPGDVEYSFNIVTKSNGLTETKRLAENYVEAAIANLADFKDSSAKKALENLAYSCITRMS